MNGATWSECRRASVPQRSARYAGGCTGDQSSRTGEQMRLPRRIDAAVDAMLREWGRWRRLELRAIGAPWENAKSSSWQRFVDVGDGAQMFGAEAQYEEPDEEVCSAIERAYVRLQQKKTGYDAVIRGYYVEGEGDPHPRLLRYCRYLIWRSGG